MKRKFFYFFILINSIVSMVLLNNLKERFFINYGISFIYGLLLYILNWMVPTVLFIKFVYKEKVLLFLKLSEKKSEGFLQGALICIPLVVIAVIKKKNISIIYPYMMLGPILAGIFEETYFRGFMLQSFRKFGHKFWTANIITAVFFTILHLPNWSSSNVGLLNKIFNVFIGGLVMGYIFNETGSLWTIIVFHGIYNIFIMF